jgi:hypothetical protein
MLSGNCAATTSGTPDWWRAWARSAPGRITDPTFPLSQLAKVTTLGRWMPPWVTDVIALARRSPDTTSTESSTPRMARPNSWPSTSPWARMCRWVYACSRHSCSTSLRVGFTKIVSSSPAVARSPLSRRSSRPGYWKGAIASSRARLWSS